MTLTEYRAEAFFLMLQRSDCQVVLGQMESNSQRVAATCSEERKYPIAKWKIEAFGNDQNRLLLRYRVQRRWPTGRSSGPFWIWLSKADGAWTLSGYETWY